MTRSAQAPATTSLVLAFAAVYVIWGSTYLAIQFAIETLPGFLMAGTRFVLAGTLLYAWARFRRTPAPTRTEWRSALFIGGLLLLGGHGGVVWAEHTVPSSIAALVISTVPLWITLFEWLRPGGRRPGLAVATGVTLGFLGVALLIGPGVLSGSGVESNVASAVAKPGSALASEAPVFGTSSLDLLGVGALLLAAMAWAAGSVSSRGARLPRSPLLSTSMQMVAGGALLLLAGIATGELGRWQPGAVSMTSVVAWVYLVVFGSIVAFTAYVWLLQVAPTSRVATYAYVNPVVAVFLGWTLAGETLTPRTLTAATVIVVSVAVIIGRRGKTKPKQSRLEDKRIRVQPTIAERPISQPCGDPHLGPLSRECPDPGRILFRAPTYSPLRGPSPHTLSHRERGPESRVREPR